jgi:hypothetical protein
VSKFDGLIDGMYEAAVVIEQWPMVLEQLSKFADADGGVLFTMHGGLERWIGTPLATDRRPDISHCGAPDRHGHSWSRRQSEAGFRLTHHV